MNSNGIRWMMILALFAVAAMSFGCSKEDMIEPEESAEPLWRETEVEIDGIILSMEFNNQEDLFVHNLNDKSALLYTPDGGVSWGKSDSVNAGETIYRIRSFTFDLNGDLVVGTKEGAVFYSTDNGDSLVMTSEIGTGDFTDVRALGVNQDNYIFAAVFGAGVYVSSDSCKTWTNVGAGLANRDYVTDGMVISEDGDLYVSCWGGQVYKTTDNGSSWTQLELLASNYQTIQALGFRSNDELVGGYDGGFCYYDDSIAEHEWVKLSYGFPEVGVDIRCIEIDSEGILYAGTYGDGVFHSTNNGFAWSNISAGLPSAQVMALAVRPSDDKVFLGTYNKGIYYKIE